MKTEITFNKIPYNECHSLTSIYSFCNTGTEIFHRTWKTKFTIGPAVVRNKRWLWREYGAHVQTAQLDCLTSSASVPCMAPAQSTHVFIYTYTYLHTYLLLLTFSHRMPAFFLLCFGLVLFHPQRWSSINQCPISIIAATKWPINWKNDSP